MNNDNMSLTPLGMTLAKVLDFFEHLSLFFMNIRYVFKAAVLRDLFGAKLMMYGGMGLFVEIYRVRMRYMSDNPSAVIDHARERRELSIYTLAKVSMATIMVFSRSIKNSVEIEKALALTRAYVNEMRDLVLIENEVRSF